MKTLLLFLLMILTGFSYAQTVPELFKKFNPVYPSDNKLLPFAEKAGLLNKMSYKSFAQLSDEKNKQLLKEFKKVDSILTLRDNKSPIKWEGSILKVYNSDANSTGELIILEYPEEFKKSGFSTKTDFPIDSFPKLNLLKKMGHLVESKFASPDVNEIDNFPKPMETEEYANHLLSLIYNTLTSYEEKLKFPYLSYVDYENKKNLSPLLKKINFRIAFLKRCYANI